jgi:hypothetical protein
MLRALIVLLLLANLAFFAWTQGWLDGVVGVRGRGDHEPERFLRQVRPETIRILPPDAAASASSPASAASSAAAGAALACFEAGPFSDASLAAAQATVQGALPVGSWITVKSVRPGAWLVYMGRYATRDAQTKKEDELKRRQIPYDEVREPAPLAPGLSLGRFDDRSAADRALEQYTQQGIRTARVVELSAASASYLLRVERADAALSRRLGALPAATLAGGFAACARPPGA